MKVILVIYFCIILCGVLTVYVVNKNRKDTTEKRKEVIEKTIEEEYKQKCKFVFTKCREKQIKSFDTPEEIEILKIIANSYGIENIEDAKQCYYTGKPLVENEEEEQRQKMLHELRDADQREFEDAKKRASIKGKEKYIPYLEKLYRNTIKNVDLSTETNESSEVDEVYSTVSAYKKVSRFHEDRIENFNKRICDESNVEEKFQHLIFTDLKCLVLKSKNVRVSGFVKIDEDMKLLGSEALLDGSIKINVLDENEKVLGYGYYSTGRFKDGNLIDSGFTKFEKRFSAICIIDDYEKIKEGIEYKFKIEPVNMWLIES